ncbi:MAG: radical SAM protein [Acidobacteriota bacterium]
MEKTMKVLLVEPPFMRLRRRKTTFFPIGLGYLAGVLAKHSIDVKIYNAEHSEEEFEDTSDSSGPYNALLGQHKYYKQALADDGHPVWREIEATIAEQRPGIVGITSRSAKFPSALKIAAIAKRLDPDCHVVLGGPHPTIKPDECILDENVDFVVRGEGEETFLELCEALDDGSDWEDIAGMTYMKNGEVVHTEPRAFIGELDELPMPARDLVLYPESYPETVMGALTTSRGCAFKCGYCSAASTWSRKVRMHSVDSAVGEIRHIVEKYGAKSIVFWDDSFTVNRKRILELCQALIDSKLDIRWSCTTRVDLVDDELLASMKRAGCTRIDLGVESGSNRMLKIIDKGITTEKVKWAVDLIHKHKIQVSAFFMAGFPEETEEDLLATIKLMKSLDVETMCLSIFTPYPGTALYDMAHSLELIPEITDWADFDHHSPENFFMAKIEREVFKKRVSEMVEIADRHRRPSFQKSLRALKTNSGYYMRNPNIFFGKVAGKLWAQRRSLPS